LHKLNVFVPDYNKWSKTQYPIQYMQNTHCDITQYHDYYTMYKHSANAPCILLCILQHHRLETDGHSKEPNPRPHFLILQHWYLTVLTQSLSYTRVPLSPSAPN